MSTLSETQSMHPLATGHLPAFFPSSDGSDLLFILVVVALIGMFVVAGAVYFTLHSVPENIAHEAGHTQFQVVGILALLALFTHNNLFWVIALVIAAFKFPDFLTPIKSIARSLNPLKSIASSLDAIQLSVAAPRGEKTAQPKMESDGNA